MEQQAFGTGEMRLVILVIGLIALALIYVFGRPRKPGQGKRTLFHKQGAERVEPTFDGMRKSSYPDRIRNPVNNSTCSASTR